MDDRNWGNGWADHRDRSSPTPPPIDPDLWTERTGGWTGTPAEWNDPSESGSWYRYDVGTGDAVAGHTWEPPTGEWLYADGDPRGIAGRDTDLAVPGPREPGPIVGPGAWHRDSDEWERLRPPSARHAPRAPTEWDPPDAPPLRSGPRHGLRAIEGAADHYPVPFRRLPDPPKRGVHSPATDDQPYWPVIGWTVAWFSVPLLGYLAWALAQPSRAKPGCLTPNGAPCPPPRSDALHSVLGSVPRLALALAIGMVVAMMIRRISETWSAVVIAFAGGVIGAAVVTAIFTVIGPATG